VILDFGVLQGVPESLFSTLLEICRVGGRVKVNMTIAPCYDSFSQVNMVTYYMPPLSNTGHTAQDRLAYIGFEVIMIGRQVIQRKGPSQ
jgi:hypothetical protein